VVVADPKPLNFAPTPHNRLILKEKPAQPLRRRGSIGAAV